MNKLNILMALHSHQPVGNFDHVFSNSYEKCYRPFLDVLADFEGIRLTLHYTGPLLEWLEKNRPAYLDDLKILVQRGQVELMGGGFYEPILASIPEDDAKGQINMMDFYLRDRFGAKSTGLWCAERVWDPDLPRVVAPTGLKYTLLDDNMLLYAGLKPEMLKGYYVTEKAGHSLAVFPIAKELRYLIPFKSVPDAVKELEHYADQGRKALTYGDDSEKFGIWPGTYEWVFEKGWLREFFRVIQDETEKVDIIPVGEYLNNNSSEGRVYIPTASYQEMMEWALPPEESTNLKKFVGRMQEQNLEEEFWPYIKGGIWQNYLAKYEETNRIHKKMIHVSNKIAEAADKVDLDDSESILNAKRELYMGQCNCAYWHGLFGGLYLNFLRNGLYEHLIKAENLADSILHNNKESWIDLQRKDFDSDMDDELLLSSKYISAYFKPSEGGSMFLFEGRNKAFNFTNTLTRRFESYHSNISDDNSKENHEENHESHSDEDGIQSIHNISRMKQSGLKNLLIYDNRTKACFVDRFLPFGLTLNEFMAQPNIDEGNFHSARYSIIEKDHQLGSDNLFLTGMTKKGVIKRDDQEFEVDIKKLISAIPEKTYLLLRYILINHNSKEINVRFSPEMNFTMLAGNDSSRYYIMPDGSHKSLETVDDTVQSENVVMVDDHLKHKLIMKFNKNAQIWRYPIFTVSQSEGGFESCYQGSAIFPIFDILLEPEKEFALDVALEVEDF